MPGPVPPASPLFVHQFELGPMQNFVYLVGCAATRACAVVDPGWDARAILAEAERLEVRVTDLLCTHSHYDHVNAVEEVLSATDARVHMLAEEVDFSGFRCENLVRHAPGDRLALGPGAELTFLHTPGHTPGSTTYRLPDAVLTGDTLFVDGCGRCDLVGGDPRVMYETLRGLVRSLPPGTWMYPGHDYGDAPRVTLDAQLRTNPYLKHGTVEDFVRHRMRPRAPSPP